MLAVPLRALTMQEDWHLRLKYWERPGYTSFSEGWRIYSQQLNHCLHQLVLLCPLVFAFVVTAVVNVMETEVGQPVVGGILQGGSSDFPVAVVSL